MVLLGMGLHSRYIPHQMIPTIQDPRPRTLAHQITSRLLRIRAVNKRDIGKGIHSADFSKPSSQVFRIAPVVTASQLQLRHHLSNMDSASRVIREMRVETDWLRHLEVEIGLLGLLGL